MLKELILALFLFCRLFADYLPIARNSEVILPIVCRLYADYLPISRFKPAFADYMPIICRLFADQQKPKNEIHPLDYKGRHDGDCIQFYELILSHVLRDSP